jgi:hypothetical protein
MKDFEEKDEQAQDKTDNAAKQQSDKTEENNWDKHQQIDEEGNEVEEKDI